MTGKRLSVPTTIRLLLVLLLFLFLGLGRGFVPRPPGLASSPSGIKLKVGNVSPWVEVVTTPAQIERGLSGKSFLPKEEGMIFVFDRSGFYPFWMKGMLFPLDFVWIGRDKKVAGVTANVAPETYPQAFLPPLPVKYVLEVNAGWVKEHGIKVGDAVSF